MLSMIYTAALPVYAASKKPAKVKGVELKAKQNKIVVTWKKAKRANKYIVYVKINKGKWKKFKTVSKKKVSYTAKKNTVYRFKVQAIGKGKGKKSSPKKINFKYFIKLKSAKKPVVNKGQSFTVKVSNPGNVSLSWNYDASRLEKVKDNNTAVTFKAKKAGKTNIKIFGGKKNSKSANVIINKDPSELEYTHDDCEFEVKIVNPNNNKIYNGGESVLPIYFKTDAPLEDYNPDDDYGWDAYIVSDSENVNVGDYYNAYSDFDSWEMIMMGEGIRGIHYYDVHYKDPNANAQKSNADYTTVDNGYLSSETFGSIKTPTKTSIKAGDYKVVVIDWDADGNYAKVRAVSNSFHIYNISERHNKWIQEITEEATNSLSCLADYNICNYEYEEAQKISEKYPDIKKALEFAKIIRKKYDYPEIYDNYGWAQTVSIRTIQNPGIDKAKVCEQASFALIALLNANNIACKPVIYSDINHQITGVIVEGKTYEIDSTPSKRTTLYPAEQKIHNDYQNTDEYYEYINLD